MSEHSDWCRQVWRTLSEGGAWCLPGTALIFNKRGGNLVLVARMPYHKDLPMSEAEWKERQDDMLAETTKEFGLIGVPVIDETDKSKMH